MSRRIPLLPILLGVLGAWAMFGMLAAGNENLSQMRLFIVAGAGGALFALLVRPILHAIGSPASFGRARFGCLYGGFGIAFVAAITVLPALMIDTDVVFRQAPGLLAIASFGGLGVLGGVMLARFRAAEADRQQLALARELQERLLPPPTFEADGVRITARNVPAAYVAGDFYDFIPLADGGVLVVVADVAGKGVAAGLIMATVKAVLPLLADADPAQVLRRVNERLVQRASRRDFVALVAATYEPRSGRLSIANAALPDPLVIASDGSASRAIIVDGPRYPAGIRTSMDYQSTTITLAAGERMVIFTDGMPEAVGYDAFTAEVQRSRGDLAALFAQLERKKTAHDDDWTAVALERVGTG